MTAVHVPIYRVQYCTAVHWPYLHTSSRRQKSEQVKSPNNRFLIKSPKMSFETLIFLSLQWHWNPINTTLELTWHWRLIILWQSWTTGHEYATRFSFHTLLLSISQGFLYRSNSSSTPHIRHHFSKSLHWIFNMTILKGLYTDGLSHIWVLCNSYDLFLNNVWFVFFQWLLCMTSKAYEKRTDETP